MGYRAGGSTRGDLTRPSCSHAGRSPEVVVPDEAALQRDISAAAARRASLNSAVPGLPCARTDSEQRIVLAAAHDEILRLTVVVPADGRFRELCKPDAEVDVGAGIVGAPALPAGFASVARRTSSRQK